MENREIAANAFAGQGGNIQIDVDPSQGLVALPVQLVDASNRIVAGCAVGGENRFVVTGRGGLPPTPQELLNTETMLTDWATLEPEAASRRIISNSGTVNPVPTLIVEASEWEFNDKNEVVLTAASTNKMRSPASNCNGSYSSAEILLE